MKPAGRRRCTSHEPASHLQEIERMIAGMSILRRAIAEITTFDRTLFPRFGLPETLPPDPA